MSPERKSISKIQALLLSSRPKTLPAAVSPVLVGAALAFADGPVNIAVLAATFLCTVLIQIGTNYANDYYDFVKGVDTEHRVGPTRATQAGLLSPGEMRAAFVGVFALAALLGVYLILTGGLPILIIGVLSVACGILYTAGPYPLGYVGLGDVFVLVFFGPVAVAGTYYLQRGSVNEIVLIAGLAPGLLSAAILDVNNFRDNDTDRQAGKKTLVVRFGPRFGQVEYIFCVVTAGLIPPALAVYAGGHYRAFISLFMLLVAYRPVKTILTSKNPVVLNKLLAQTGMLLAFHSVLFSVGWLL